MNRAYRPVWGILFVALGMGAIYLIARGLTPREIIPWRTDYAQAVQEAKASHKPLFLYFTADWCGPCQSLRHTTWADHDVERALRAYVPVKLDIDAASNRPLVQEYVHDAIPCFVVFQADGSVQKSSIGALEPDDFLAWLKEPAASPR